MAAPPSAPRWRCCRCRCGTSCPPLFAAQGPDTYILRYGLAFTLCLCPYPPGSWSTRPAMPHSQAPPVRPPNPTLETCPSVPRPSVTLSTPVPQPLPPPIPPPPFLPPTLTASSSSLMPAYFRCSSTKRGTSSASTRGIMKPKLSSLWGQVDEDAHAWNESWVSTETVGLTKPHARQVAIRHMRPPSRATTRQCPHTDAGHGRTKPQGTHLFPARFRRLPRCSRMTVMTMIITRRRAAHMRSRQGATIMMGPAADAGMPEPGGQGEVGAARAVQPQPLK